MPLLYPCFHQSREPLELEEEVVESEGSLEELINVENNLRQDAHFGIVRCLMANPTVSNERRRTTVFYTIVKCGETLMKMVINGGCTMNIVAQSAVECCHMKVRHQPSPFKVAWVNKTNLTFTHRRKVCI